MTTNNKCHPRILPAGTIYMMVSFERGVRRTMSRTSGVTTVEHEKGLHARPASVFVQTASEFEAEIEVVNAEGEAADAKSSIGVISLGVEPGDRIEITAQGDDAGRAVDRLVALVENGFELNGK